MRATLVHPRIVGRATRLEADIRSYVDGASLGRDARLALHRQCRAECVDVACFLQRRWMGELNQRWRKAGLVAALTEEPQASAIWRIAMA